MKTIRTMKHFCAKSLLMALAATAALGLAACSDDDDDKPKAPVVTLTEANIEDDELCVEADIVAEGRTASVVVTVDDAANTTTKLAEAFRDAKYIGVLNIDGFHEHIEIDGKGIVPGDVLKLTVTDQNSKATTARIAVTQHESDN